MKTKWKTINNPMSMGMAQNSVLNGGKNFYISYNPNTSSCFSFFSGDNGGSEETALCNRRSGNFYILNGDFRKDYEKLSKKGYKECKAFYNKMKKEYDSSWSTA